MLATWALLAALASPAAGATKLGALNFHENDYAHARAEAERRGLPVFVEVWAPW